MDSLCGHGKIYLLPLVRVQALGQSLTAFGTMNRPQLETGRHRLLHSSIFGLFMALLALLALVSLLPTGAAADNQPPTAFIDVLSPNPGYDVEWYTFSGHGEDDDGDIIRHEWYIDGNLFAITDTFNRTGFALGNYTIIFRVQDNNETWSENLTEYLQVLEYAPPIITDVDVLSTEVYRQESTTFYAEATDDLDDLENLTVEFQLLDPAGMGLVWSSTVGGPAYYLDMSSDGESIVVGTGPGNHSVYFFKRDLDTYVWHNPVGESSGSVKVALSANGKYVLAGNYGHSENPFRGLYLFHYSNNTPLWKFEKTYADIKDLDISADGRYIIASTGASFHLFHRTSSEPLWSAYPNSSVAKLSLSADGKYIVAGTVGKNQGIYLYERSSSIPVWQYRVDEDIKSLVISADGNYLVAGSSRQDGVIYFFHRSNGTPLWSYDTGGDTVNTVAMTPEGQYIVAGTGDGKIYMFQRNSSTPIWIYATEAAVNSVAISSNGEIVTAVSNSGVLSIFRYISNLSVWKYNFGGNLRTVVLSADGNYVATGNYDRQVYLLQRWRGDYLSNISFTGDRWQATFVPLSGASLGDYSLRVRFTSSQEYASPWYYYNRTITVSNSLPRAYLLNEVPEPLRLNEGESFVLNGNGSDSDGTIMAYRWQTAAGKIIGNETKFVIANLTPGNHPLQFAVQDNDGAWSPDIPFNVSINGRPRAIIHDYPDQPILRGTMISLLGSGYDPEGSEIVAYRWSIAALNITTANESLHLKTDNTPYGRYTLVLEVQDVEGSWSEPVSVNIYINGEPVASIDHVEYHKLPWDRKLSLYGSGSDPDGRIELYQWRSSQDGVLGTEYHSFSSYSDLSVGTHWISLRVLDNKGMWSEWVNHDKPVEVPEPLTEHRLFFPSVLSLVLLSAVVVAHYYRQRLRRRTGDRFMALYAQLKAAGIPHPVERFEIVAKGLRESAYRRVEPELEVLLPEMEERLSLRARTEPVIFVVKYLFSIVAAAGLEPNSGRLEQVESMFEGKDFEQAYLEAEKFKLELEKLLEQLTKT